MARSGLTPGMRRVSARTRLVYRASACGAMRRRLAGEAEAEEFARTGARDRAVDLQLQAAGQELLGAGHDPLPRPLALHIDIAVIGVADKAVAASLQIPCSAHPASGWTAAARAARPAACPRRSVRPARQPAPPRSDNRRSAAPRAGRQPAWPPAPS